jgi:hypothetical protein
MFLVERDDVADYCSSKTYEVWDNDCWRVILWERAISRLYTALQLFLERKSFEYRGTVISAVVMLAENENPDDSWDEPTLERAISLVRSLIGEHGWGEKGQKGGKRDIQQKGATGHSRFLEGEKGGKEGGTGDIVD